MPIQDKLAYSLDRNDQEPNKVLAEEIVNQGDDGTIQELIDFIESKPVKRLQMDAALTLAYVAEKAPGRMIPHVKYIVSKLSDPISRVGWGSMIGLSHLSPHLAKEMYQHLTAILDAMDQSSVVGRDHGFRILVDVYQVDEYTNDLFYILLEQIKKAPSNQLGQYVERWLAVLKKEHKQDLIETLEDIRNDLSNEYHLKRLDKNLKKLYK